jgi:hypothetical protein
MGKTGQTDWEITATTVYCDAVGDEVTLIVHRDGTSRCTWYEKYVGKDKESAGAVKSLQGEKRTGCLGTGCPRITQYRDSLINR